MITRDEIQENPFLKSLQEAVFAMISENGNKDLIIGYGSTVPPSDIMHLGANLVTACLAVTGAVRDMEREGYPVTESQICETIAVSVGIGIKTIYGKGVADGRQSLCN